MSGNRHDMSDAERHGPYTTRFNRCSRWSRNGTWASIMERLQWLAGGDGGGDGGPPGPVCLHMADSSLMRGHGAGAPRDGARYGTTARNFLSAVHLAVSRFLLRRIASQLLEPAAQKARRS